MQGLKTSILTALFLALILLGGLFSLTLGTADIGMGFAYKTLWQGISGAASGELTPDQIIILKLRVPRILLGLLVGGALAASGAVLQGIFRNPMADPYVLGISSGAAFSITLTLVLGVTSAIILQTAAFAGAMGTALLGLFLSRGLGRGNTITLLLTGITLSFLFSAVISFMMYLNREIVESILFWTFGSFSAATWSKVQLLGLPLFLALGALILLAHDINLLTQGEDVAQSVGVNVGRTRILAVLLTSFLTASAVSVSGIIGFVGLIVPHSIRAVFGPDYKKLTLLSALAGAFFTMAADSVARIIMAPAELPVGILTALLGAPYFLIILTTGRMK